MAEVDADGRDERRRERSLDRRRERSPARNHREDRGGRDDRDERRRSRYDERRERDRDRDRERDRERDQKRRKSSSPYRDRRLSPRSPASKRSNFDSHDRSRTFGGEDRGPRGPSDWNRTGRNSGFDVPPSAGYNGIEMRRDLGGGLMSYKQFILDLEDDVSPTEAEHRYAVYKNEYISSQKSAFFNQHKDEEWLREKYDPTRIEALLSRRNENAQVVAKEFMEILLAGNINLGPNASMGRDKHKHEEDEDDVEMGSRRRKSMDVRGQEREELAPKAPSKASEPERIAFDIKLTRSLIGKLDKEKSISGNLLVDKEKIRENVEAGVGSDGDDSVVIRGPNSERTLAGIELLDTLLTYLWRIHGVDYYGATELKNLPKGLRTVRATGHSQDLSASASDWEKKVNETWKARLDSDGQDPLVVQLGRDKLEKAATEALENYVRKIKDEKYGWKYGCGAKGCTKLFHGPEYVYKHLKLKHPELMASATAKVQEEIYQNNYMNDPDAPLPASGPPARPTPRKEVGPLWRPDLAPPPSAERGAAGLMRGPERFDRGMRDPGRFERDMEREPEEQERFERNGMDGGDRFARLPPPRDVDPFNNEGGHEGFPPMMGRPPFDDRPPFDAPLMDVPMFDPFDAPPLRPPFGPGGPPEPPPMLIPVPGAGPLGPFVPAPPEVAMRMMRPPPQFFDAFDGPFEPGPPPPFEVEGEGGGPPDLGGMHGGRGRGRGRGREGPMGGRGILPLRPPPSMMIPIPPGIRPDPRRMRSYKDLDAPDDEVTVIDYRSL